jgi:protein phosphatase
VIVQIEYPDNVHLIRGNHEAADINALFGFRIECIERMVKTETYLYWFGFRFNSATNLVRVGWKWWNMGVDKIQSTF